jgi:hypothetical protein
LDIRHDNVLLPPLALLHNHDYWKGPTLTATSSSADEDVLDTMNDKKNAQMGQAKLTHTVMIVHSHLILTEVKFRRGALLLNAHGLAMTKGKVST